MNTPDTQKPVMSLEETIAYCRNLQSASGPHLGKIFTSALHHLEAGKWRDISTVPKDGTYILLAAIDDGVVFDVLNGYFEVLEHDEQDGPWDIRDGEPWCSYEGREAGTYFCSWLPEKELDTRSMFTSEWGYTHWKLCPPAP